MVIAKDGLRSVDCRANKPYICIIGIYKKINNINFKLFNKLLDENYKKKKFPFTQSQNYFQTCKRSL